MGDVTVTEWLGLERIPGGHLGQLPCSARPPTVGLGDPEALGSLEQEKKRDETITSPHQQLWDVVVSYQGAAELHHATLSLPSPKKRRRRKYNEKKRLIV